MSTAQLRDEIPYGYCHCGCGEKTSIAKRSETARGYVKGQPMRFVCGHKREHLRGADSPHYNGGLSTSTDGRTIICCRDGSIMYYSRGLMAAHVGRLLRPDELVHHVNEDPTDDRIENYEIVTRAEHVALHRDLLNASREAAGYPRGDDWRRRRGLAA